MFSPQLRKKNQLIAPAIVISSLVEIDNKIVPVKAPIVSDEESESNDENSQAKHLASTEKIQKFLKVPIITLEDIKTALTEHAQKRCGFTKRFPFNFDALEMYSSVAYKYVLKTYVETRRTRLNVDPFDNVKDFNIQKTGLNDKWNIRELSIDLPEKWFTDCEKKIPINGTERIKKCDICLGNGSDNCDSCTNNKINRKCKNCHGEIRVYCNKCNGSGKMKQNIELIAKYKTHMKEYYQKRACLPEKFIHEAVFFKLFEETADKIQPIQTFPDEEINRVSFDFLNEHLSEFSNEKIIAQNHSIWCIPIVRCEIKWHGKMKEFWVYGIDHRIYLPSFSTTHSCY